LASSSVQSTSTTTVLNMTNACDAFYADITAMTEFAYINNNGAPANNDPIQQVNMMVGQQTSFTVVVPGAGAGVVSVNAGSAFIDSTTNAIFGQCVAP